MCELESRRGHVPWYHIGAATGSLLSVLLGFLMPLPSVPRDKMVEESVGGSCEEERD